MLYVEETIAKGPRIVDLGQSVQDLDREYPTLNNDQNFVIAIYP